MAKVYVLDECASTNLEAQDRERYGHGDVIMAIRQTAGRGQRGNKWESAPGENLTFSIVLEPSFLPAAGQFLLSEAAALAVADTLGKYGIEARIKWTNDIYVGDGKICGMLIEHDLHGANLARSIVGIGINVNQSSFPPGVPNPASMTLETGLGYDTREVLDTLLEMFRIRYALLEAGDEKTITEDYHTLIYRRDESRKFFIPGEGEVIGTIRSVESTGRLMVEINGILRGFLFKEVEFII